MSKLLEPLRIKEFRRFWFSGAISVFGDHLTFVAMPWLVLKLTGDPVAMGMVIAIAAIPRAFFMLFGGALSDRWSPRLVMLASNLLRFLLVGTLAGLTYLGAIDLPLIFVIAFLFGLADAFLFPAAGAMPPRLLEKEQLAPPAPSIADVYTDGGSKELMADALAPPNPIVDLELDFDALNTMLSKSLKDRELFFDS